MSLKKPVFALAALSLASAGALAQSTVSLYGIVDAAVRIETNHGPANNRSSLKTVAPGGMSQSRLGVNVTEDLGDGWRAMVNLEHRLMSDTGAQTSASDFWRQAWVGLVTPAGAVRFGRQYNVLFDVTTATFAAFRYSPYIEQFKPEIGVALSGRQSNMVKYLIQQGGFTAEAQVSAGEASGDKTVGAMGRYQTGGFAFGAGYINAKDPAGKQVKARVIGGSYTNGPIYINAAKAWNDFDSGFNTTLTVGYSTAFFSATTAANVLLSPAAYVSVKERDLTSVGMTYQLTPQFNLGVQFYRMNQTNYAPFATGSTQANMFAVVADYALSKRTDVYAEWDRVSMDSSSLVTYANGARKRSGYMTGIRHRF